MAKERTPLEIPLPPMKVPTEIPELSLIETCEPCAGIVKENFCS